MLIIISPAKSLNFDAPPSHIAHSEGQFLADANTLMQQLRQLSRAELGTLLKISPNLSDLNHTRNQNWQLPFSTSNAKQALLAFTGDVYQGLAVADYSPTDLAYTQDHLRILSGLYGLLRPLDLIQPYRLEMGTKFATTKGANLYQFWDTKITTALNTAISATGSRYLVNLASNEYFKAVKPKQIVVPIITPVFKDFKNGQYKVISFLAKKARGRMSSYILTNKMTNLAALCAYTEDGYSYNEALSSAESPVFTRG